MAASGDHLVSEGTSGSGLMLLLLHVTRSQKAQKPEACSMGGPAEPMGQGRTPEAHSQGPRTHPEGSDPGAQGQEGEG